MRNPGPLARALVTAAAHGAALAAALAGTHFLHAKSGRLLWGVFDDAFQVRQLALYVIDTAPVFALALIVFALAVRKTVLSPIGFAVLCLAAGAATVALTAAWIPVDARAATLFAVFVALYAGAYGSLAWALGAVGAATPVLPRPRPSLAWPAVLVLVAGGYLGFFQISGIAELETYRDAREPSARAVLGPAGAVAFVARPTGVTAGGARIVDLDGDGDSDVVVKTAEQTLELWRNDRTGFARVDGAFSGVAQGRVRDFYFADADGDGDPDLLTVEKDRGRGAGRLTGLLVRSVWYLGDQRADDGHLYRNDGDGRWTDVTATAFPGGAPVGFRKVEPVLWFDADGDGDLDFVWSQYPSARKSFNRLYVQQDGLTFTDALDTLIDDNPKRVYPEGSDIADIDGDGDLDVFAYGYLFLKDGDRYIRQCGARFAGLPCRTAGRIEEGATFEDVDGDGRLDVVLSYHGPHGPFPKYGLQVLRNTGDAKAPFEVMADLSNKVYGFNTYLRAKDFDADGRPDILTVSAGRLLSVTGDGLIDRLPAVTGMPSGAVWPMGWIDADEDGDWDFLAIRQGDRQVLLYENQLDPVHYIKVSALGPGGRDNQIGATVRVTGPDGRTQVHAYRPVAGYAGSTDPRIVLPFTPNSTLALSVCFASLTEPPGAANAADGVTLDIVGVKGNCVDYRLAIASGVERVDLDLVAGRDGARVRAAGPALLTGTK